MKTVKVRFSNSYIQKYSLFTIPHVALLQEKKLLDLPKLLDICAIYAHENDDLTRLLVLTSLYPLILY